MHDKNKPQDELLELKATTDMISMIRMVLTQCMEMDLSSTLNSKFQTVGNSASIAKVLMLDNVPYVHKRLRNRIRFSAR